MQLAVYDKNCLQVTGHVPGRAGVRGNEVADKLARTFLFRSLRDQSLFGGRSVENKIKRWMDNQHLVMWRGPCGTQRQARELKCGPYLATRARLLSFSRIHSRVVIGLLTGHITLRRHLYVMGLSNNPVCIKNGTEEETSAHILCACEPLASLSHSYLGSSFLDPEDIRKLNIGAIRKFAKGT